MHTRHILLIIVITLTIGAAVLWKSSQPESKKATDPLAAAENESAPLLESDSIDQEMLQPEQAVATSEEAQGQTPQSVGLQDADLSRLRGDVYKRFDEILSDYGKRLPRISAQQALKEIPELRARLKRHKDSFPLQSDLDEGSMRRIDETLELLPEASAFDKSNCREYKLEILAQFDPKAPNEIPTHPSVRRVFDILDIICRK